MYLKFNLNWGNSTDVDEFLNAILDNIPERAINESMDRRKEFTSFTFRKFMLCNYNRQCWLDGDRMQEKWFPDYQPDIFLSHSGKDTILALKLKRILERMGLTVFVDSTVWGCIYDLQKKFDNRYCRNRNSLTYSYKKRNNSTAAVHMMLSTALTQVMDHSEYVFFLNTSKSNLGDAYGKYEFTDSPWIYHELSTAKVLRQHHGNNVIQESRADDAEAKLIHGLDMHDFLTLTLDDFRYWVQKGTNESPESILYDLLNMKAEQKRLEKLYSKIDESIK